MNAIVAPKSRGLNWLEGFALTFLMLGFPTFASAALLLKLVRHDIAGGVVLFVALTSVLHGLFTPWLAPKFPKLFRHGYSRCSSTPACRLSKRSRSGAPSPRRRFNW